MSAPRPHAADVAVFICSADSRRDVLERVLPSVAKFWADCPYPIHIGLNSPGPPLPIGRPVFAPAAGWRHELTTQLRQIEQTHLIVLLDDFLLRAPVNQARLAGLVGDAIGLQLPYLRLIPMGRSLLGRISARRPPGPHPGIERIRARHPFYSGLQIAIWRKAHLSSLLQHPVSIWEFERLHDERASHCAVTGDPPFAYRHLVEQGRWLPGAPAMLRAAGLTTDLGSRSIWPASRYARLFLDQVRWTMLGYSTC